MAEEENSKQLEKIRKNREELIKRLDEMQKKYLEKFNKELEKILRPIYQRINEINREYDLKINYDNNKYKIISDLEEFEIDEKLIGDEEKICAICLENYCIGNKIVYLPCGHYFHSSCIKTWININKKCPYCKNDI